MRTSLPFRLFLVTIAAAVTAYYALASVGIGGLMPHDFKAAEVIRERCPLHLVPPAWVSGSDQLDVLVRWNLAEMETRVAVVLALWLLSVSLLVGQYLRRGKKGRSTPSSL